MAVQPETQKVIDALNTATTNIATRIQQILADSDLTADEKAQFQPIVDNLNALGTNPNNPVPPLPPVEP